MHVTLTIADLQGRRVVRHLVDGERDAGDGMASWNGRDETGRRVPAAVYFCRLEAAGGLLSQRVIAMR